MDWIHPTWVLPNGVDPGFGSALSSEDFYGDMVSDAIIDCRSKRTGMAILRSGNLLDVVGYELIEQSASLRKIGCHGLVFCLELSDHLADD